MAFGLGFHALDVFEEDGFLLERDVGAVRGILLRGLAQLLPEHFRTEPLGHLAL